MSPRNYFIDNPDACQGAKDFCAGFTTMRDAWLSDDPAGEAHWMLWALGKVPGSAENVRAFATYCAAEAAELRVEMVFSGTQRSLNEAVNAASAAAVGARLARGDVTVALYAANAALEHLDAVYHATDGGGFARASQARLTDLLHRKKIRELFPTQFEES